MRARCAWLALSLLGLMGLSTCIPQVITEESTTPQPSGISPAKVVPARTRPSPGGPTWRIVIVLSQSQPDRLEVQRAWEDAVHELSHANVELAWVEPRQVPIQGTSTLPISSIVSNNHPTALLNRFCAEIHAGKTILAVIIGGGAAARFLVTSAGAMKLPTLWLPFSHRDFIKQGRPGEYESRVGISSEEMGAAAAALMHKAHWRAFTLLIDTNLLPVHHFVREHDKETASNAVKRKKKKRKKSYYDGDECADSLVPRNTIYLPSDERKLALRLRRVAEENGRGSVIVLACDLVNAKKVIALAQKNEMLAGRFLWLWLDLKSELRSNEPNIIGQHILSNARVSVTSDHMPPIDTPREFSSNLQQQANERYNVPKVSPENERFGSQRVVSEKGGGPIPLDDLGVHMSPDRDVSIHTISNLASEVHKIQEFHWQGDFSERPMHKRESSIPKHNAFSGISAAAPSPFIDEEETADVRSGWDRNLNSKSFMPLGMLALRPANAKIIDGPETILSRALREGAQAFNRAMLETRSYYSRMQENQLNDFFVPKCLEDGNPKWAANDARGNVSMMVTKRLRESARIVSKEKAEFHLLNLQGVLFPGNKTQLRWTKVGMVRGGREVRLDTIIWPGGGIVPAYIEEGREKIGMPSYKIVTALAPPFAMITDLQEGTCLRGLICKHHNAIKCCFGYSMDLLYHISQDLEFRFDLHIAKDGLFGRRRGRNGTWNGIVGELVSGKAQLAFAPLSVYSHRTQVVDFTTPYYFSSVSFLTAPKERNNISLLAFLQPFSPELWIAVFTSLNITAMFVAAYEWFSPFGLNPWGRQRSKNFSIASALWVMWGLLCGHLVAFKAPKSWPNKFLINVWGGFSVIFVASYTANIAALIAGLFFHSTDNNYKSRSLLLQKVAAPKASAAEFYVQQADPRLWSYMSRFSIADVADGVQRLLNGSLDILIADTPIIDWYRATDNGCRLEKIGDTIKEDTYAVALSKGHPMKESISKIIANYTSTGLLDILQEKWYGGLPCMHGAATGVGFDGQPHHGGQPRPLGVASVAGVFCLLGLGMTLGVFILIGEHIFYKYTLPKLRQRPKNSIWRSPNVMFFSQKLYRFINCVDLVSPHHAARELVHTVRQGQITSLFQKSVKRKEHEQRRRRKSKAQFFEMIQEIRRVQQEEKSEAAANEARGAVKKDMSKERRSRSRSKSPMVSHSASPRSGNEKSRSSTNLSHSRMPSVSLEVAALEGNMKPREFTLSNSNLRARSPLELVGRRLSHGDSDSPPPTPKGTNIGGSTTLKAPQRGETIGGIPTPKQRSPAQRGQSFPVFATLRTPQPSTERPQPASRSPLLSPSEMTSAVGRKLSREWGSGIDITRSSEAIPTQPIFTLTPGEDLPERRRRKKNRGEEASKQPMRRARSHENKERGTFGETSPRIAIQELYGGESASARAKRQLESELKAILSARATHLELHPP